MIFFVFYPAGETGHQVSAEVSFTDNLLWDIERVESMKKHLSELYDVPMVCVTCDMEQYKSVSSQLSLL